MRFDLQLFQSLNEEYRPKPLSPEPRKLDPASVKKRGNRRADKLVTKYGIRGKYILEIGCGRGETCRELAADYGCKAVGVDIKRYPEWDDAAPGMTCINVDLAREIPAGIGPFDFVFSFSVLEHVRHPYSMLKSVYALLKPGGQFHLSANLYRGPKASHRYREVFFPWPHLLFTDEVFREYYESIGRPPARPAWVNQLSIADYYRYFDLVGFKRLGVSFVTTPIDEAFYRRFADKLERIPRYDLERDFITAQLQKPGSASPRPPAVGLSS